MRSYFGGKSRVAHEVWARFGDVQNFVEPFCGSAAVLLARPTRPRIETVNDANCFIANFWRAVSVDPEGVAELCDWPVNEVDLHARHRWLMLSGAAAEWRDRMRRDPDYYDVKVAAWWVWGACAWIGAGWCDGTRIYGEGNSEGGKLPYVGRGNKGVHSNAAADVAHKRPSLASTKGVLSEVVLGQLPTLSGSDGASGRGIHASGLAEKRPALTGNGPKGVQGRGGQASLVQWFGMLQQRLRRVRVTCGDWSRVVTPAVTSGIGVCGVFLDPPYSDAAGRDSAIYGVDDLEVAHRVREWCLERGGDPMLRIALCGYEGEHEQLEAAGWSVHVWKTSGGYGNQAQGGTGHTNRLRERIWFSPHCLTGQGALF